MTTDRDRIDAACRAFWQDWDQKTEYGRELARVDFARALAAADAIAPNDRLRQVYRDGKAMTAPPVPDREAVASAFRKACSPDAWPPWEEMADYNREWWLRGADAVLALLPAAPPAVPEEVRRACQDYRSARDETMDYNLIVKRRTEYLVAVETWIGQLLLSTPTPPADTGDGGEADTSSPGLYERALLGETGSRLARKLAAERDTLARRVRELEEALRAILREVESYARDYDAGKVALGAYHACSKVHAIIGGSSHD